jgi:hypothetical protein
MINTGSLMKHVNNKKIIFAHQAKSAGTTLVHMFWKSYGRESVYRDNDREHLIISPLKRLAWRSWEPLRMFKRRRYDVIHGHFPAIKYRRYFNDAFYMTFYRHPVEQIASHYYWLRTPHLAKSHPLAFWLHQESPDLIEFAQQIHTREQQLFHVKYFWPEDFDFIGLTEMYDDSLNLLSKCLPELCTDVEPQRVNPERGSDGYELSRKDRSKLEDVLWLRIAVYERARSLFEARRQLS